MPGPREQGFGPSWLEAQLARLAPAAVRGWCVAWSGGADSTALLSALVALRDAALAAGKRPLPLRAIHIDHQLQAAAADFRRQCRRQARRWSLPLTVIRVAVDAGTGRSVEEAAREARYAALAAALRPGEGLLLAQHGGDQLETFLLQALRGAGVAGLAAMPERSPLGQGWLLRPLLDLSQSALRAWLQARGVDWIEDPSNDDLRFDRNYLRRTVLPALLARWPAAPQTLARSARHAAVADEVLRAQGTKDAAAAADGAALDIRVLNRLSPRRQALALRAWLDRRGLPLPDERGLGEVLRLLALREDAQPCVRWAGAEVRRHAGCLHARAQRPEAYPEGREPREWRWTVGQPLQLPGGGSLVLVRDVWGDIDLGRLPAVLNVGFRADAGAVPTGTRSPNVDLKSLLRESGIPAWQRGEVPLLWSGARLLAVADLWHDRSLQATKERTNSGRFVWRQG